MYIYLQKYCLIINPNIYINFEILKNPGLISFGEGGVLVKKTYKLLSNPNLNPSDARFVNKGGGGHEKIFSIKFHLCKEIFLCVSEKHPTTEHFRYILSANEHFYRIF